MPQQLTEPSIDGRTISSRRASAIAASVRSSIHRLDLDLSNHTVVTEAATGSYAVTAAAAAAAGAEVHALAMDSPYGSRHQAIEDVEAVVESLGTIPGSIHFAAEKSALPIELATIITNSGFIRPIDAPTISRLSKSAVIALMYEAWEARQTDIDYGAAERHGIEIIGVNEHHPACDAFRFVGDLALYGIRVKKWPVRDAHITVFSDNAFGAAIEQALTANGATVVIRTTVEPERHQTDLVVVAMTPPGSTRRGANPDALSESIAATTAYGCVQLWGDVSREALSREGIDVMPAHAPSPGHQGIPMTAAGDPAVVRLQLGGLAAAVYRDVTSSSPFHGLAQPIHGDQH